MPDGPRFSGLVTTTILRTSHSDDLAAARKAAVLALPFPEAAAPRAAEGRAGNGAAGRVGGGEAGSAGGGAVAGAREASGGDNGVEERWGEEEEEEQEEDSGPALSNADFRAALFPFLSRAGPKHGEEEDEEVSLVHTPEYTHSSPRTHYTCTCRSPHTGGRKTKV
jgi:hypothetical protein